MVAKEIKDLIKVVTGVSEIDRLEIKSISDSEMEVTVDYRTQSMLGSLLGIDKSHETKTFIIKKKE